MQETQETRFDPWVGKILGVGNDTHSSILAWKIPWTKVTGGIQSTESQRVTLQYLLILYVKCSLVILTYFLFHLNVHENSGRNFVLFYKLVGRKITSLNIEFSFQTHQFSSVSQSCPTLCNPMNCSTSGLPVHHQLPEFTQTRCPLSQ